MPSLHPPETQIGLDEAMQKYECQVAVAHYLQQNGFGLPAQPAHNGQLPEDLTTLTDDQVMGLLNHVAIWHDYVQGKLAEASMNKTKAQEQFEHTEAQVRLTFKYDAEGKKQTVQERDDLVKTDRRYVDAKARVIYFDSIYSFIRGIANAAERNWNTISRRITQRGQDLERDRNNKGGNIPMPPTWGRRT